MDIISQHFSQEELKPYVQRSDLLAWWMILLNWVMIAGAFALVAWQANLITIAVALVVLGNRQLGCGVIMHECGHGSLFSSRKLNRFVGEWLGAAPTVYRLDDYMQKHLKHHRETGTLDDPDLHRYRNYPTDKASFRRRLIRDVTGQTSWKNLKATLRVNDVLTTDNKGRNHYHVSKLFSNLYAPLITNGLLLLVLSLAGYPALYLLWVAAYFSTYTVFSRIRNLAEHAAVPDLTDTNPLKNTRTTIARWWERFTYAPNSVNYHLEHHLMPSIPQYRLASFHRALAAKGILGEAEVCRGYGEVIRKFVTAPAV